MQKTTLCLLVRQWPAPAVLLGLKKRGFGQGKYTGFGGKVAPDESVAAAAVRELAEESGLTVRQADLQPLGAVTFCFPTQPDWTQRMYIFLVRRWSGLAHESEEMAPTWFAIDQLPYNQMWQDAHYWLPLVLAGRRLALRIYFAANLETVDQVVYE
jgi:8-oxo-dGTP diphosphatase